MHPLAVALNLALAAVFHVASPEQTKSPAMPTLPSSHATAGFVENRGQ